MQRFTVEKDGALIEVKAEKIGEVYWFHYEGKTVSASFESQRGRSSSGTHSLEPGHVVAPMPGKVLKISAQPGQAVKPGEVVVIMEAMKMEYSLTSDIAGKVENVNVGVGDQVMKDQLLVQVKES